MLRKYLSKEKLSECKIVPPPQDSLLLNLHESSPLDLVFECIGMESLVNLAQVNGKLRENVTFYIDSLPKDDKNLDHYLKSKLFHKFIKFQKGDKYAERDSDFFTMTKGWSTFFSLISIFMYFTSNPTNMDRTGIVPMGFAAFSTLCLSLIKLDTIKEQKALSDIYERKVAANPDYPKIPPPYIQPLYIVPHYGLFNPNRICRRNGNLPIVQKNKESNIKKPI